MLVGRDHPGHYPQVQYIILSSSHLVVQGLLGTMVTLKSLENFVNSIWQKRKTSTTNKDMESRPFLENIDQYQWVFHNWLSNLNFQYVLYIVCVCHHIIFLSSFTSA